MNYSFAMRAMPGDDAPVSVLAQAVRARKVATIELVRGILCACYNNMPASRKTVSPKTMKLNVFIKLIRVGYLLLQLCLFQ
jgi:hypothetical protein